MGFFKAFPRTNTRAAVIVLILGTVIVNLLDLPSLELVGSIQNPQRPAEIQPA